LPHVLHFGFNAVSFVLLAVLVVVLVAVLVAVLAVLELLLLLLLELLLLLLLLFLAIPSSSPPVLAHFTTPPLPLPLPLPFPRSSNSSSNFLICLFNVLLAFLVSFNFFFSTCFIVRTISLNSFF
jgi:hypothetical protein